MTSLAGSSAGGFSDLPLRGKGQPEDRDGGTYGDHNRSKMIACTMCRRRKLKCDGNSPSCATCTRQGRSCEYAEGRKRSGPRKGYVRGLESRVVQLEAMLQVQQSGQINRSMEEPMFDDLQSAVTDLHTDLETPAFRQAGENFVPDVFLGQGLFDQAFELPMTHDSTQILETDFSWEIIETGLEEPLPLQASIDELTEMYFHKIHPSAPILHQFRYLAAMNLSPRMRPSIALRYAVWSLAASIIPKYGSLKDHFYARARKYAELAEMRGRGEGCVNLYNTQAWALIGLYEFRMMYFPRAWLSTSRAVRLAQMLGMHKLDTVDWGGKQITAPPQDWVAREERRRTFWMTFCLDRNASVGSGWPVIIDEKEICTNLPCSEEAYEQGSETVEMSLSEAMIPMHASKLSPFAGVITITSLFGRALMHVNAFGPDEEFENLNSDFWRRHRNMDSLLLNTSLHLPTHLRLPSLSPTPNTVFLNLSLHAATICLHQLVVVKAEKRDLPSNVVAESKMRCLSAALEVVTILRMVAHMDFCMMHSFAPFASFVACRIFVKQVKQHPEDEDSKATVQFMLSAIAVMGVFNPLAASFLGQLEAELEGSGIAMPQLSEELAKYGNGEPFRWVDGSPFRFVEVVSPSATVVDHASTDPSSAGQTPSTRGSSKLQNNPSYPGLNAATATSTSYFTLEAGNNLSRESSELASEINLSAVQRDNGINAYGDSEDMWEFGNETLNVSDDFLDSLLGSGTGI